MLGMCDFSTSIVYHPCIMASDVFVNRQHCPMLVAQWQNAVTRKDMAEAYSYKDFKEVFMIKKILTLYTSIFLGVLLGLIEP